MLSFDQMIETSHLAVPNDPREGNSHFSKVSTTRGEAYIPICTPIWSQWCHEVREQALAQKDQDEADWRRATSDT